MEPIVINKCKRDKKVLKDFYFYHIFLRPFSLICEILLALVAVAVIPLIFKGNVYAIVWTAVVFLYALYKVMQYRMSVKYVYERECKLNGGSPLEVTLCLYQNLMVQRTELTPDVRIPYTLVKTVRRLRGRTYLMTKSHQAFILGDEGYLKGSFDEVKALIEAVKTKNVNEG